MLVLITYDVILRLPQEERDCGKLQSNALIMADECRILFSNAFWIMHSVLP